MGQTFFNRCQSAKENRALTPANLMEEALLSSCLLFWSQYQMHLQYIICSQYRNKCCMLEKNLLWHITVFHNIQNVAEAGTVSCLLTTVTLDYFRLWSLNTVQLILYCFVVSCCRSIGRRHHGSRSFSIWWNRWSRIQHIRWTSSRDCCEYMRCSTCVGMLTRMARLETALPM